jgi:DNA-binding transcriptional ArsR family regulator
MSTDHRAFKDALYTQFARIGQAVSSPKRLELLDLLGQGEKTVEQLAEQTATAVKNTSAHLRALRQARLVETRRDGTYVWYRLADEAVAAFLLSPRSSGINAQTIVVDAGMSVNYFDAEIVRKAMREE